MALCQRGGMRKKSVSFLLLVCLVGVFSLSAGCKSAAIKPVSSAPDQVKVEVQPEEQPPQVQPPMPLPAEQPPQKPAETVVPPQKAVAPAPPKKGDVSFNFDDADVFSVIQTIFGDVLRVNYIIDPSVKGKVNFRSVAPVAKEDVLPLMEVILRLNGIGIVEEGGLYRIVPIADIGREPSPVGVGREPGTIDITGKALVQVVPIRYGQSSEMVRILTPFLSKNAVIVDVAKGNYIVIVDTDSNVKRLLQLVDIFDNEKLKQVTPKVFVYPVQNSKAKDVAALLTQIFMGGKGGAPAPAKSSLTTPATKPVTPGAPAPAVSSQPTVMMGQAGTGESLVSEITRIIPDEITNSVIILATPDDYALIMDTIQKVDIPTRQVLIEGLIVSITLTDNLSYGLSYSMNTDLRISGLKPFVNPIDLPGSDVTVNASGTPGLDPTKIPGKGFTFVGHDPTGQIRAVLTALQDRSKAKVVAAPHILVSDNREARIQIGQQIPIATSTSAQPVSGTTTTATTSVAVVGTSTIQYKDIGIILKVKPQVNDSGLISLELSQEISSVGGSVNVGGLAEITIDKTEATSNLVARDGETIVIGGLIREDNTHETAGIPYLSRIPILGALFGSTSDTVTRKELIILLTPHVMRNQQEAQRVTSEYIKKYKVTTKDKDIDKFMEDRSGAGQNGNNSTQPLQ